MGINAGALCPFALYEWRVIPPGAANDIEAFVECSQGLMTGSDPPSQHVEFRKHEQRAEDRLIVPGQPERKIDVKIVSTLVRVTTCEVRQRAPAAIAGEDRALNQHGGAERGRPAKFALRSCRRYSENASYEEDPYGGAKKLDGHELTWSMGYGGHGSGIRGPMVSSSAAVIQRFG